MSWWNRTRKIWLSVLLGLLLLFGIFIGVMRFIGPRIGNTFCTLAGCLGSETIAVLGLPDGTRYHLSVHGETLTCQIGKDEWELFGSSCVPYGVASTMDMDVAPPEKIAVTVAVHGKRVSYVLHPTVSGEHYPNGKECGPVCYSYYVVMDLSRFPYPR